MSPAWVKAFTSGMKMMMVGTGSMQSPTTVNSSTSNSIMICGSLPAIEVIQSAMTMAPRRYASIQPKALAAPMVISGSEKISPARQKSYGIFLMCPRLSAGITTVMIQTTATTPASVGVNQPVRMPPTTITGITTGSAASPAAETNHRRGRRQPAPDMPDKRHRKIGYSPYHIRRAHELADQQEKRDRQQRLGIHAVKNLLDDRRQ